LRGTHVSAHKMGGSVRWVKETELMGVGKRRLAGDTAWSATTDEQKYQRNEARDLKEGEAEQTPELAVLKKA